MKKIAIIGKGTSSIVTAMTCLNRGHEIHIYSDPDTPYLSVGESTTPPLASLILKTFDLCIGDLLDKKIVSYKSGIKFINWGVGKDFLHHFATNRNALHFESGIFNPFMHNLLKDKGVVYFEEKVNGFEVSDNVIHMNDRTYDFVVSCVGWDNNQNYLEPMIETVNAGILYKENGVNDPTYTLHRATKHGWQFGLPFPQDNVTKCGYLFNSKIYNPEEVYKEIEDKNHSQYASDIDKIISWKPKFSSRIIENRYHAYNGNRLFFLEPLQALSVHYYVEFAGLICDYLDDPKQESFEVANNTYLRKMFEYQISIAWHYSYGSIHKSEYWKQITEKAKYILSLHPLYSLDSLLRQYYHDSSWKEVNSFKIGVFEYKDFRSVHNGMTGTDIDELKNFSFY